MGPNQKTPTTGKLEKEKPNLRESPPHKHITPDISSGLDDCETSPTWIFSDEFVKPDEKSKDEPSLFEFLQEKREDAVEADATYSDTSISSSKVMTNSTMKSKTNRTKFGFILRRLSSLRTCTFF